MRADRNDRYQPDPNFDPSNPFQSNRRKKEYSPMEWAIAIAVGIFLGGGLLFMAEILYTKWMFKEIITTTNEAMYQAFTPSPEALALAKKKAEIRQQDRIRAEKERQRQKAANAQFKRTCNFWRNEVRNNRTKSNTLMMTEACSKI